MLASSECRTCSRARAREMTRFRAGRQQQKTHPQSRLPLTVSLFIAHARMYIHTHTRSLFALSCAPSLLRAFTLARSFPLCRRQRQMRSHQCLQCAIAPVRSLPLCLCLCFSHRHSHSRSFVFSFCVCFGATLALLAPPMLLLLLCALLLYCCGAAPCSALLLFALLLCCYCLLFGCCCCCCCC